ncbi:hypothetical protein BN7_3160 [Wickerhamomyces ciferrii]|uniref:Maintenance of telomere capping protein 4 n=1 Tax=Wickerhamomyces ciferrii (strain ATCC 14091 / BCRC 22168 / CBS 111 / JCM 3599 / NBRC 0793 / NRRL Y-1031 F-60-10) TaxID=1206466 RepID=K0KN22_WICCF|nr:uncharacterized protein BN7_3160 [Wickerhamomyces ciferrii]CCH43607.1 hypothetical protein BN7_3160 [Wickerhamomyces ciferrii]
MSGRIRSTGDSQVESPNFDEWISKYSNYDGGNGGNNGNEIDYNKSRRSSYNPKTKDIRRKSIVHTNTQVRNPGENGYSNGGNSNNGNGNGRRKWSSKYKNESFEFDPLGFPKNTKQKRNSSLTSSENGSSTANDQDSNNSNSNSGLLVSSNDDKNLIKEAGQLASVLLEMRKNITTDYNIDLNHNENLDLERDRNIPGQIKLKNISRSTIQRCEKVKVMFNLYYFYLFNSQKSTNTRYQGVDGIFNPLQVIRNRSIRKKYHNPPKLAIKTLPYASSVFSRSKNKLKWQVDLTELTYDFNWRAQHWHELKNSKGELWFPIPKRQQHGHDQHGHHRHHRHHNHRHSHRPYLHRNDDSSEMDISYIHDKLFEFNSNDEDQVENGSESEKELLDNQSLGSSKEDLSESRSRKRDRLASKIRKRSKSPFKKRSNQNKELDPGFQFDKNESFLNLPDEKNQNDLKYKNNLLNDISIEPIKSQRVISNSQFNTDNESPLEEHQRSSSLSSSNNLEHVDNNKDLNLYSKKLVKLNDLINFGKHYLFIKDNEYSNIINLEQINKDYEEIKTNSNFLKTQVLNKYEDLILDKTEYLESIQSKLTNNYSPRIDKLLLLSDRTIGEVNTTLSLEVRKLNERLEKLGPSYKRSGSLVELAYWLLENFIVLVLWTIWIGFSIGRIFKFFFMIFWKVLKWVFY